MTRILLVQRVLRPAAVDVRLPSPDRIATLLMVSVIGGWLLVLATTPIGSGDYGQWLMAARPHLGLDVPGYRADGAVPPLVPATLATIQGLVGDPIVALQMLAMMLAGALGAAAALAGAAFFRSRIAALLSLAACLLFTDRYLELFAFGGLLQAAAVVFLWLSVAAFYRAGEDAAHPRRWWTAGAASVGLGALSHVGTALLLVPAALAVGSLNLLRSRTSWRTVARQLAPLGAVIALASVFWTTVLLPGGAEFASNPASLAYRGPSRLIESVTSHWPTAALAAIAAVGLLTGSMQELRRRRIGPWLSLAAWTLTTLAAVLAAILTGVATDYPRFATPLLAPIVVAGGGATAAGLREAGQRLSSRTRRGTTAGWAVGMAMILVLGSAPAAVLSYREEASGYGLAELDSVRQAGAWIEKHVEQEATVLAPVREGKWIEGLTGRAALFNNPIRYSFRSGEWQRSLAADAILRSHGALLNEFFFVRFVEGTASTAIPRELAISANHGGEFVELLRTAAAATTLVDPSTGHTVESLSGLSGSARTDRVHTAVASISMTWSGEAHGQAVSYRQTAQLRRYASTLELRAGVTISQAPAAFEFELRPMPQLPVTEVVADDRRAELVFTTVGTSQPRLRITVARGAGTLEALPDGGLRVRSQDAELRLLVADLTGTRSPSLGLMLMDPAQLAERYNVGAVLLRRDPSFDARLARLESLGFRIGEEFGSYVVLVRS